MVSPPLGLTGSSIRHTWEMWESLKPEQELGPCLPTNSLYPRPTAIPHRQAVYPRPSRATDLDLVWHILTARLLQPGLLRDLLFHPVQPSFVFQTWRSQATSPRKPSLPALVSQALPALCLALRPLVRTELLSESLPAVQGVVTCGQPRCVDILRPPLQRGLGVEGGQRRTQTQSQPSSSSIWWSGKTETES